MSFLKKSFASIAKQLKTPFIGFNRKELEDLLVSLSSNAHDGSTPVSNGGGWLAPGKNAIQGIKLFFINKLFFILVFLNYYRDHEGLALSHNNTELRAPMARALILESMHPIDCIRYIIGELKKAKSKSQSSGKDILIAIPTLLGAALLLALQCTFCFVFSLLSAAMLLLACPVLAIISNFRSSNRAKFPEAKKPVLEGQSASPGLISSFVLITVSSCLVIPIFAKLFLGGVVQSILGMFTGFAFFLICFTLSAFWNSCRKQNQELLSEADNYLPIIPETGCFTAISFVGAACEKLFCSLPAMLLASTFNKATGRKWSSPLDKGEFSMTDMQSFAEDREGGVSKCSSDDTGLAACNPNMAANFGGLITLSNPKMVIPKWDSFLCDNSLLGGQQFLGSSKKPTPGTTASPAYNSLYIEHRGCVVV